MKKKSLGLYGQGWQDTMISSGDVCWPRCIYSYEHEYINEAKSNNLETEIFILLHFQELESTFN